MHTLVSKDSNYVSPLQQLQTKNGPNKRIRVSRACDTCRKRKVKCDGKQPCIHCTVYSYECTYNHLRPVQSKRKMPQSQSIQSQSQTQSIPHQSIPQDKRTTTKSNGEIELLKNLFPEIDVSDNFNAELFIKLFNQHKKDGLIDMKGIVDDYKRQSGITTSFNPIDKAVEIKIILPPREIALKLIYKTWNESCVLFRFYHRPSFIRDFNSLYETSPTEYTNHQNKILPLIYSVIAVGALFSKGDNAIDNQYLQDEGYKYFIAARKLIDITNSTDLESIQTIFMLTLFLQCSARLSTCYSYIGIALRSALRQGLHRKLEVKCNNIKAECKKRLFWTIYKLEIYVNSMLGLPNSIDEDDINAEFPKDVDDVNIEADRITEQQVGKLSSCGINNSHTKLILILNHIVRKLYKTTTPIYEVPNDVVKGLENELKLWIYELPLQLQPENHETPPEYIKANRLLYLDYLHVEIMLYRPFIHYVKLSKNDPYTGIKSYQYENGLKCFEVSKKIISLAQSMIQNKLLNGSYWFSVYTIFFSVACLVYYFLEIDNTNDEVKQSIETGKLILSGLKQRSVSAERIYDLLNYMFENYDRHNIRLQDTETASELSSSSTKRIPQTGPFTSKQHMIPTYTPMTNTAMTNQPMDNLPQTIIDKQIDTLPTESIDDLDMQLFGKFLPSYMLQKPSVNDQQLPDFITSSESPEDPLATTKTDEEFDWDRFIDKGDLNFDIDL